jgi:signal transduction histidine kinase
MFSPYKNSLRYKTFLTLLGLGIIPFALLLIYVVFLNQNKLIEKTIEEEFHTVQSIATRIKRNTLRFQKEMQFLSSLEILQDLKDTDKISDLLVKKAKTYNEEIIFFIVNTNKKVIATSKKDIQETILHTALETEANFVSGGFAYFQTPIFDKNSTKIATLVAVYPLHFLDKFLIHDSYTYSSIINPKANAFVGDKIDLALDFTKEQGSAITKKYLVVYKKLPEILEECYIVYAKDRLVALEYLHDFVLSIIYVALFILPTIIYLAYRFSKSIVEPIDQLTALADGVTKTQDYSKRIKINSDDDEVIILTNSFNKMLQTTQNALMKLEEENTQRLKRFTKLIEIFNTIIKTKTQQECINTSLVQIGNLTQGKKLQFHYEKPKQITSEYVELYVTDFENNTKSYYGCIELGIEAFHDIIERNFYHSIASMISLQLDRIRLIDKTMAASKAKSAFISNMSHELRTPLNAIIGFSQFMLSYEELTKDQQDSVSNIESSAQYLLAMINDILDIAKIEAGKLEPNIENVNVSDMLHSVYEMLRPLANEKNISLEIEDDTIKDLMVETDAKMVKQIVINITSNAIKFTQEGSIHIRAFVQKDYLHVEVQDTGIGIEKEDLATLFQEFTQVENVMQKKHKGTGLGLAISKKMAQILGGDLVIESAGKNKGTTSRLTLALSYKKI